LVGAPLAANAQSASDLQLRSAYCTAVEQSSIGFAQQLIASAQNCARSTDPRITLALRHACEGEIATGTEDLRDHERNLQRLQSYLMATGGFNPDQTGFGPAIAYRHGQEDEAEIRRLALGAPGELCSQKCPLNDLECSKECLDKADTTGAGARVRSCPAVLSALPF
jgi:hypothetical protein